MSSEPTPKPSSGLTLIVPCAAPLIGPRRPKWLLTTPSGDLLVAQAAHSIAASKIDRTIVICLREAEEKYGVTEVLRRAFAETVECVVLDGQTAGPAETVYEAIRRAGVTGPIVIKDSDSFFADPGPIAAGSFVAVTDIRTLAAVSDPGKKSFVRLNEQGVIDDIIEKDVASNLISIGLYGFDDATMFTAEYESIAALFGAQPRFVSHIVASCIGRGQVFQPLYVDAFVDIGTRADWTAYRGMFPTIVLDIDGVIFRNQSLFFPPYWGDPVEPIAGNVEHLLSLQERGAQLIFMTARPEPYREATMAALSGLGLRVHALVMGCKHGTRYLVNDFAASNPYPTAIAVNTRRNSADLPDLLFEDHRVLDQEP